MMVHVSQTAWFVIQQWIVLTEKMSWIVVRIFFYLSPIGVVKRHGKLFDKKLAGKTYHRFLPCFVMVQHDDVTSFNCLCQWFFHCKIYHFARHAAELAASLLWVVFFCNFFFWPALQSGRPILPSRRFQKDLSQSAGGSEGCNYENGQDIMLKSPENAGLFACKVSYS